MIRKPPSTLLGVIENPNFAFCESNDRGRYQGIFPIPENTLSAQTVENILSQSIGMPPNLDDFRVNCAKMKGRKIGTSCPSFVRSKSVFPLRNFFYGISLNAYSRSLGLLNSTVSFMLPCPICGNPSAPRFPGSRFDAVSSGGKRTSALRKASR